MKLASRRVTLAAVLAIGGVTALSGCSVLQQFIPTDDPVRDATSGEITESNDNADVFAIRVGDCLNTSELASQTELTSVPVVPCEEPHEDEVFYATESTAAEYPGEDALLADADAVCIPAFAEFIGMSYEESVLDYWPMYPTQGSWDAGDRETLCIAWDPAGDVTGTLAGAAR